MSKIRPKEKSKIIDRSNEEIKNFWLKKEHNNSLSHRNNYCDKIISLIDSAHNSVICIMSEDLSDKRIIKAIFSAAADKGNRIYVMSNKYNQELHNLQGCLIRYELKNIGSLILINPNTDDACGRLYTGPFSESGVALDDNILLDIDTEQISVLYQHFCYHFWNTAKKEVGQEKEIGDAPIGIYKPINNFCDSDYVKKEILSISENANIISSSIINSSYLNFSDIKKTTIITSLLGNNNSSIPSIKKSENSILAFKREIVINIINTPSKGTWIIPKAKISDDDIFFALKMNQAQTDKIETLIDEYKSCANYEFLDSEKRGNLSGKTVLLLGQDKDIEIKEELDKDLGDNKIGAKLSPYSELESLEPEFPDTGDVVKTKYIWSNVPFYLPQNNVKHELYAQWDRETKRILDSLDIILKNIDAAEKKESSLSKRIVKLFLGKKNAFNQKKDDIEELKKQQFSLLKYEDLKEKIERINKISSDVAENVADIEEEDRKAKIDEAIEKLNTEIEDKETELKQKEEEFHNKENENRRNKESFCATYIERKKADLNANAEKRSKEIADKEEQLNKKKAELTDLNMAEKQKEISALEVELKRMKEELASQEKRKENQIKSFSYEYSTEQKGLSKIEHELRAQKADELLEKLNKFKISDALISKAEDEIKKIKREIQLKKEDIEQKEKDKNRPPTISSGKKDSLGSYLHGEKSSNNNVNTGQRINLVVPTIPSLPQTGTLYKSDNKSYLAIKDWDDFNAAQAEANRLDKTLHAILCAERSDNG